MIFIIWFREGPEALSHCMVSMVTDLFGGLGVAVVGERETYSKNQALQVWQELDQFPSRGAGRGRARLWGPYRRGRLSPPAGFPPSEAAQLPLWLLEGCCFSHGPSG